MGHTSGHGLEEIRGRKTLSLRERNGRDSFQYAVNDAITAHSVERECFRELSTCSLEHEFTKSTPGAVKADFYAALAKIKDIGYFIDAHLFDVTQHEDGSVGFGQLRNSFF
jgi:hypothetical protein